MTQTYWCSALKTQNDNKYLPILITHILKIAQPKWCIDLKTLSFKDVQTLKIVALKIIDIQIQEIQISYFHKNPIDFLIKPRTS